MSKNFVIVVLAAAIGVLLASKEGRQLVAAATAAVARGARPISETEEVLNEMNEVEMGMVEVIVEREFLKTAETSNGVDVDGLANSEHRKLVEADGALMRAAIDVRQSATLKEANDLAGRHKKLQGDFVNASAKDLLVRGKPLPLKALSQAQRRMLAKQQQVVPHSADAVAERGGR